MSEENSNINVGLSNLSNDEQRLLISYFELYNSAKKHKDLYHEDRDYSAVKTLLELYYRLVNPDYNNLIFNFRNKYISNEILVEKNNSVYERRGISLVYDYIQYYDINKEKFNIFIMSMRIHMLLYKPLDDLHLGNKELLEKIVELEEELKVNKDIRKYKELRALKKEAESSSSKFGGQLRKNDVSMLGVRKNVPSANEASSYINSFINPEKVSEYERYLNGDNIFEYIDYCVKTTVSLIKYQPFQDGNKRTFRSLLNLMFKNRNIPPVYIKANEREEYKDALLKAVEEDNYEEIIGFYYYKICDSIYELDIEPFINKNKDKINTVKM